MEKIGKHTVYFDCGQRKTIIEARCTCGKIKNIQKQRFELLSPNATCGECPKPILTKYIAINAEGKEVNSFESYEDAIAYSKITLTQILRLTHTPIYYPKEN